MTEHIVTSLIWPKDGSALVTLKECSYYKEGNWVVAGGKGDEEGKNPSTRMRQLDLSKMR